HSDHITSRHLPMSLIFSPASWTFVPTFCAASLAVSAALSVASLTFSAPASIVSLTLSLVSATDHSCEGTQGDCVNSQPTKCLCTILGGRGEEGRARTEPRPPGFTQGDSEAIAVPCATVFLRFSYRRLLEKHAPGAGGITRE